MPSDTLAHIHLMTCVGVDTEYAHLPHFIEHYLALGIRPDNFHVILNSTDHNSANLRRAQALLLARGLAAPIVWIASYTSDGMWAKRREVQARTVPAQHWVISADVDEFHEYPEALPALLAECELRGVNCIQGVFIDRLAPQGRLAQVDPDTSIWQTFPLQADVQCAIGQTGRHHDWYGTVKVMALKGSLFPSRGGHHPIAGDVPVHYLCARHLATFPAIGKARFRFAIPLRVHHFKWTAAMPDTLRRRLATPGVSPAGAEYGQKLLDYFDRHQGVRMADVSVRKTTPSQTRSWRRRVVFLKALDLALRAAAWSRYYSRRARARLTS